MNRGGASIVPLCKAKGDKCECINSRGISLFSVVGKLVGRVLIKRVRGRTECAIGEEQCEFRQGRGCMEQVCWAFMDLEKSYTIDRHGMWQMLSVYGVGGNLLKAEQSFYVDSRACVPFGNDVSEWFLVNVGLRQGCVINNVYM